MKTPDDSPSETGEEIRTTARESICICGVKQGEGAAKGFLFHEVYQCVRNLCEKVIDLKADLGVARMLCGEGNYNEQSKLIVNVIEAARGHNCPRQTSTGEHEVCDICGALDAHDEALK